MTEESVIIQIFDVTEINNYEVLIRMLDSLNIDIVKYKNCPNPIIRVMQESDYSDFRLCIMRRCCNIVEIPSTCFCFLLHPIQRLNNS